MARDKSVRVELTRSDLAKRGLATLIVAALLLALIFTWTSGVVGGPDTVTARLTNAGGSLVKNATSRCADSSSAASPASPVMLRRVA